MATYPIKMLRDEEREPFVPFTTAGCVVDRDGKTLQELMDGKYSIQNNLTTDEPGKGVLDAYQGKVLNDKFNDYVPLSQKGVANGVATLDSDGLVPSAQLPSYVDDVLEAYIRDGSEALSEDWLSLTDGGEALTPETGKIYVIMTEGEDENHQYRWSGNRYVLCNPSDVNSVNGMTGVVVLKYLTITENGDEIGTYNGTYDTTLDIHMPTDNTELTNGAGYITKADDIEGNAATASRLLNPVEINGTSFDGSRDITTNKWGYSRNISIQDADGSNTGNAVGVDGSGNATLKLPSTIKATLNGNADSATLATRATTADKADILTNSRLINVSDADGSHTGTGAEFNGSAAITIKLPSIIKANLEGNADSATFATEAGKATKDAKGNIIDETYETKGNTITDITFTDNNLVYTKGDGSSKGIDLSDLTISPATSTKLGGIKVGAGLTITDDGTLSTTGGGVADAVEWEDVLNKPTEISYWENDAGYITRSNVMSGATQTTAGEAGTVPAPESGYQNRFLRGDGQWAEINLPEGAGYVIADNRETQDKIRVVVSETKPKSEEGYVDLWVNPNGSSGGGGGGGGSYDAATDEEVREMFDGQDYDEDKVINLGRLDTFKDLMEGMVDMKLGDLYDLIGDIKIALESFVSVPGSLRWVEERLDRNVKLEEEGD